MSMRIDEDGIYFTGRNESWLFIFWFKPSWWEFRKCDGYSYSHDFDLGPISVLWGYRGF